MATNISILLLIICMFSINQFKCDSINKQIHKYQTDDFIKRILKRFIPNGSNVMSSIEQNSKVKIYLNNLNDYYDDQQSLTKMEFIEHPQDTLMTGKLPVLIQCTVKNSFKTVFECNNKIREDVKSNISMKENLKYEQLTLMIKKKDVEQNSKNPNRKIACKCIAYTDKNEKISSNKAIIKTAYLEDEFQSEPMDEVSYEGETVEMRCDPPKGEPVPNVYWLKDNKEIDTYSDSSRFKLSNDFSLLILASKKIDSGNYVCVASNLIDKRFSKPARLTLLDPSRKYMWSKWSDWSECSVKCGPGIIKRTRSCQTTNNLAQLKNISNSMCDNGPSFEEMPCQIVPCSAEEPKWSEWSQWSICNNECKQYRRRFCENESEESAQAFSLDKPSSPDSKVKTCIGEKVMIRSCNLTNSKTCKEKLNPSLIDRIKLNNLHDQEIYDESNLNNNLKATNQQIEQLYNNNLNLNSNTLIHKIQPNKQDNDIKFDQTFLKLGISLSASILLASLLILLIILAFVMKRNKSTPNKNRSELNLYYTCEKQMPADDECSIFKFSKGSTSTTDSSSSSSSTSTTGFKSSNRFKKNKSILHQTGINSESLIPIIYNETSNRILNSMNIEKQLLLGNIQQQQPQQQQYQIVQTNNNNSFLLSNTNTQQYLNLSSSPNIINSPFRPINQNNTSLSSSGSSVTNKNITTTTTVTSKSINSTSSPSSNIYYETPNVNKTDYDPCLDDSHYNYNDFLLKQKSNESLKYTINSNISYQQQLAHLQQIKNKQDEELAYDIADNLQINEFKKANLIPNSDLNDICMGQVNSNGARLTLDCGISLFIPEGALAPEQSVNMYLGICRNEIFKPRLNEKNTFLSEIIQIGPSNLNLLKPVILIIDNCAKNLEQDWNLNLFTSFNSFENPPEWIELQSINSDNNTNLNFHINSTSNKLVLITDKMGRFCLTGESKCINNNKQAQIEKSASKYYRLVTFCSSSITNNEFNLRIYCIDNLLVALQEVLRDEKNIGGTLLESSEPFLISHSNLNDSISICVDELNKSMFNCKYDVNCQEIPLSHIWNGRNHLLHCSFTLENNVSNNYTNNNNVVNDQEFKCKIKASRLNKRELLTTVKIQYNFKNMFINNNESLLEFGLKNWNITEASVYLESWANLLKPKNMLRSYFRIDKNLKKQLATILDENYVSDKNWRALAHKLEINRNLHYFASKTSPTEMLLLYFEAISDLKCHDLIRLSNDLIKTKQTTTTKSIDQFSSPQELLFREIFLNYIL